MTKKPQLKWHDVREWRVEGKGWAKTECYYDRLPAKARKLLPELWNHSRHATGMSVRFETDAPDIHARWQLRSEQLDEPNMSRASFSGLDIYADDRGQWRWAGGGWDHKDQRPSKQLIAGRPAERKAFCVYLPLRNPLIKLEIGVPKGTLLKGIAPRKQKPLVYYGSSIVHGAYASRPGMVFPSILGRWLDVPVVNLGFSGLARMHQPMAELLGEIAAGIFVIDALPNMDAALVRERAKPFLQFLCEAKPKTPIVLVEDFPQTHAWLYPDRIKVHEEKWEALNAAYRQLVKKGFTNLRYVKGRHSIGDDNEGTLDGIHPNDIGYERLARNLMPVLRKCGGGL
jgi:lysophospholipase L1-like esterase